MLIVRPKTSVCVLSGLSAQRWCTYVLSGKVRSACPLLLLFCLSMSWFVRVPGRLLLQGDGLRC